MRVTYIEIIFQKVSFALVLLYFTTMKRSPGSNFKMEKEP